MDISSASQVKANPNVPQISPGDSVRVSYRVKEANRERLQTLLGLVVRIRRGAGGGNFTVRRVTYGVGVEHTFPFASLSLDKVEIVRHGKVRRAKLYYIRRLSAKEARLKERREKVAEKVALEEGVAREVAVDEAAAKEGAVEEAEVEQVAAEEVKDAE